MPHYFNFNYSFKRDSSDPTKILLPPLHTPQTMRKEGFNLLVEIRGSSVDAAMTKKEQAKTLTVYAHFDTGASQTSIDNRIAQYLKLISTGQSLLTTASGVDTVSNYVIDIRFLNTSLKPILNLPVSSCNLAHFQLNPNKPNLKELNPTDFGLLIGRDIMSCWSIFWHGSTSTIMVSD